MQRGKNVSMCQQCLCKKILYWVKYLQNFTLFCRESEYCGYFALFGATLFCTFWNFILAFFCTFCVFLFFCSVLLQIRFVVIYTLFQVKYFWLKTCLCKKKCLLTCLHIWSKGSLFFKQTNGGHSCFYYDIEVGK